MNVDFVRRDVRRRLVVYRDPLKVALHCSVLMLRYQVSRLSWVKTSRTSRITQPKN